MNAIQSLLVHLPVRRLARFATVAAAVVVLASMASPSQASPETLKRSIGNITQAPLDAVLSPLVAGVALVQNLRDVDDTPGVRIAYAVPGYFWMVGVNVGASVIRGITGAIQLIPGLFLIPFEADMDPLMDPIERGGALVEAETPIIDIKFGINYMSAEN